MSPFDKERRRIDHKLAEGQMTERAAERQRSAVDRAEHRHNVKEERFSQRERQIERAKLRYRLKQSVELVWC